jgi:hypothetical protein
MILKNTIKSFSIIILMIANISPSFAKSEANNYLLSLKESQELGDIYGVVSVNDNGFYIHPGNTKPTSLIFKLNGKIKSLHLKTMIGLPEACKADSKAGVVGFELLTNGKSSGKVIVDRSSTFEKEVNLKGIKTMEFRVDNGNGTPSCDHFVIDITSIVK